MNNNIYEMLNGLILDLTMIHGIDIVKHYNDERWSTPYTFNVYCIGSNEPIVISDGDLIKKCRKDLIKKWQEIY